MPNPPADFTSVATTFIRSKYDEMALAIDALLLDARRWDELDLAEQDQRLRQAQLLADQAKPFLAELLDRAGDHPPPRPARGFHPMPLTIDDPHAAAFMAGGPALSQGQPKMIAQSPLYYGQAAHIGRQPFEEAGIAAARFTKVFLAAGGNLAMCDDWSRRMYPDDRRIDFRAALMTAPATSGGFLVPEQQSREIIELIRHVAVVRRSARVLQFNGTMVIPQVTGGVTAQYLGEMQDDNAQDLTFAQRRLTQRKLRALVVVSNDLIRSATPDADAVVRDDLVRGLAQVEDLNFIRGTGLGAGPKGFRYWALPANVNAIAGTTTAQIEGDVVGLMSNLVTGLKGQQIAPRWLMTSRSFYKLYNLRYAIGSDPAALVFPEIRSTPPMLVGAPVDISDQIPTTLGGGTESEIYLVDYGHVVVGDAMSLQIAVSDSATYRDAGGNLQSAFSQDAVVLRAIALHDMLVRQDQAVHVLTAVTW